MTRYQAATMIYSWILGIAVMLICYSMGIHWLIADVITAIIGLLVGFVRWYFNPAGI